VEAPADKPAVMLFRWHLGTDQSAKISGEGGNWQVVWPEGTLALASSVPLTVTQEKLPDNTVCLGKKDNGWDFLHTCVVVRTVQSASSVDLTTTVRAAR
jgi:hypothetical protein